MRLKEFAIPLQAFAALFLCGGMAWMIFVMAGFNPSPPTAMDIRLRSTKDVSFVSMNSTAAALAVQMVSEFVPTAIILPSTETDTAHPTATLGFVMVPVSGSTLTPSPTSVSLIPGVSPRAKPRAPGAVPTLAPALTATPVPTTQVPTPKPTATEPPVVTESPAATEPSPTTYP